MSQKINMPPPQEAQPEKRRGGLFRRGMKGFIRKLFLFALLVALVFLGVRYGPNLYMRLFGNGNAKWVSERFSETLREKNELVVCEVETTGQETVTQDAWVLGTVQKVVMPYTFRMSFTVDLSKATVSADGNVIQVRVPSPEAGYQKLSVNESEVKKSDFFYRLTPERYAEIKNTVEEKLFAEGKNNPDYQQTAWSNTVQNLEALFQSVVKSGEGITLLTVTVVRDDTLGQEATGSPLPAQTVAPAA